jgi:hypothetical protein
MVSPGATTEQESDPYVNLDATIEQTDHELLRSNSQTNGLQSICQLNRRGRFLTWCAGSSEKILTSCSQQELNRHSRIGVFVLLTTFLAFSTTYYCASTISEGNVAFAMGIAAAWAVLIFNLDRYLISTIPLTQVGSIFKYKISAILPRLVLSMLIGFTIAIPFELYTFREEINKEIANLNDARETEMAREIDEMHSRFCASRHQPKISELLNRFREQEIRTVEEASGKNGPRGTGHVYEAFDGILQGIKHELDEERSRYGTCLSSSPTVLGSKEINALESAQQSFILSRGKSESHPSLLTQYTALQQLTVGDSVRSRSIWLATIFLPLLILFVEVAPVLTKFISGPGPYELIGHLDKSAKTHSTLEYCVMLTEALKRWEHRQSEETARAKSEGEALLAAKTVFSESLRSAFGEKTEEAIREWKLNFEPKHGEGRIDQLFFNSIMPGAKKVGSDSPPTMTLNESDRPKYELTREKLSDRIIGSWKQRHFEPFIKESISSFAKKTPDFLFLFSQTRVHFLLFFHLQLQLPGLK